MELRSPEVLNAALHCCRLTEGVVNEDRPCLRADRVVCRVLKEAEMFRGECAIRGS